MFDHSGAEIIVGGCFLLIVVAGSVIGTLHLLPRYFDRQKDLRKGPR